MAHPGDGLALLGGGGGHQSPGGAEKDVPQLPALHAAEKVAAQHRGRAAAARAPGVDVLALAVVEKQAAVLVDGAQMCIRDSTWAESINSINSFFFSVSILTPLFPYSSTSSGCL